MREEGAGKRERGRGKTFLWLVLVLAALAALLAVVVGRRVPSPPQPATPPQPAAGESAAEPVGGAAPDAPQSPEDETTSEDEAEDEPRTEEEKREAEEERLVDAFDGLTDAWQEPSGKGVTMADVDTFVKAFRKIPKARQDECIHRALNLIPDENVMLLAGVLMDKSADKEIVETVYNDVLNRDEDVKRPILRQIFKDKTHPCWADTAWILDATDDLPRK